mmetsp:Transcript_19436/g.64380  ORF Transcript_19436/g.64380 Transcript_19436/m.64380 type:complete len:115 (+) Transcript_19436:253-597(+)
MYQRLQLILFVLISFAIVSCMGSSYHSEDFPLRGRQLLRQDSYSPTCTPSKERVSRLQRYPSPTGRDSRWRFDLSCTLDTAMASTSDFLESEESGCSKYAHNSGLRSAMGQVNI